MVSWIGGWGKNIFLLTQKHILGGQILAKRLKKHVLKIDVTDAAWDSYHGLEFYNFDHIANNNEFKSLYRERLDGAHVTQYTKGKLFSTYYKWSIAHSNNSIHTHLYRFNCCRSYPQF